ncbi:DUF3021 domain-containing protein [Butyricicoccus sp. 1XD8-22]|nr:DUF3021 domain-containing protein [Butyricicoccus sp. 1XD8-22]
MKKVIQFILIGALIGLSTSYIVMTFVLLGDSTLSLTGEELLLQLSIALILGITCGLISLIFTVETLPYFAKLAIHYVVTLLLVLICGAFGDWYESPMEDPIQFIFFIFLQLFIYLVILVGIYLMDLKQLKAINRQLQNRK